ncbi:MAG: hypothetical protein WC828_05560 [Thermoleophilia bacterium]|jgi:hypothetical protein
MKPSIQPVPEPERRVLPEVTQRQQDEAILKSLCYADIFDFALTLEEIVRYAQGVAINIDEAAERLNDDESLSNIVKKKGYLYHLEGRDENCQLRLDREAESRQQLEIALRRLIPLQGIPFLRAGAITGALAALNSPAGDDIDLLIISAPGRTWTTYFFLRLWRRFGHNPDICFNVFISEADLVFKNPNLFYAREILGALPVFNDGAFDSFKEANPWIHDFFPSFIPDPERQNYRIPISPLWRRRQRQLQTLLVGPLGDLLEFVVRKAQYKNLISSAPDAAMRMRRNRIKLHKRDNRSPIIDKFNQRLDFWLGKYRELSDDKPVKSA